MPAQTHDFDLAGLRLTAGEGRRLTLQVPIDPLLLGGEPYAAAPVARSGRLCGLAHDRRRLCAALRF